MIRHRCIGQLYSIRSLSWRGSEMSSSRSPWLKVIVGCHWRAMAQWKSDRLGIKGLLV